MSILTSFILHIPIQLCIIFLFFQLFYYHLPLPNFPQFSPIIDDTNFFKIHPFSMSLALIFFYETIILYNTFYPIDFMKKQWFHYSCNTLGIFLLALGATIIIYNKQLNDKYHFTSWHGFMGIITLCHAGMQFLFGWTIPVFNWQIFNLIGSKDLRRWMHRVSGCILLLELLVVFILSCYTSWFSFVSDNSYMVYVNITIYTYVTLFLLFNVMSKVLGKLKGERTSKKSKK